MTITIRPRWSLGRGKTLVPSRWQATVQPGSRLAADDALTHPFDMSHSVVVSIGCALDHLQALRVLIVDAEALHMAAPFTLTRAALENAAQALWLSHPLEQEVRVSRRLQMAHRDVQERHAAGLLLSEEGRRPATLLERQDRIAGIAEAAGLTRRQVLDPGAGWGRMVNACAWVVDLTGEQLEAIWKIGSAYAHGQSWPIISSASLVRLPGQDDAASIHDYRITAAVPNVVTAVGAATLVLQEAVRQHHRHRLLFKQHSSPSP
jgi:hypothetical protein